MKPTNLLKLLAGAVAAGLMVGATVFAQDSQPTANKDASVSAGAAGGNGEVNSAATKHHYKKKSDHCHGQKDCEKSKKAMAPKEPTAPTPGANVDAD